MEILCKLGHFGVVTLAIIFMLTVIILFFISFLSIINEKRIKDFFVSHGYKKRSANDPAYGSGAVYSWVRDTDGKRASYKDIKCLSFEQIKTRYN